MEEPIRIVIRITNTKIKIDIVKTINGIDRTLCSANSIELKNHGINCGFTNVPAAFLTGLLISCRFKLIYNIGDIAEPPFELQLDCGKRLATSMLITAVLDAFRTQCLLNFEEISEYKENVYNGMLIFNQMVKLQEESPEAYARQFSKYISLGIEPKNICHLYHNARNSILANPQPPIKFPKEYYKNMTFAYRHKDEPPEI